MGPSSQDLRTLVPNTITSMVFGIRVFEYWVLGPFGEVVFRLEALGSKRLASLGLGVGCGST